MLMKLFALQIKIPAQLDAALLYFANTGPEDFKKSEFEEACGVGTIEMSYNMNLDLL